MSAHSPISGPPTGGHGPRIAVASEAERVRAFASARRHSSMVRALKLGIPIVAVAGVAAYGLALLPNMRLSIGPIQVEGVTIDPKHLTMKEPRYDGYGKDGTKYNIRAREAVSDIKQTGPIRLNDIVADITQKSGVVTKMTAVWGTFDSKASELELFDRIDIAGSNGLKARLTHAKAWVKEGRIASSQPIEAELPTGRITARSMAINTRTHEAAFREDVAVRLFPAAAKAKPKTDAPAGEAGKQAPAKAASLIPGISGRSDVPIDITAETLDVDDTAKTAIFRTNVVAKQGEASLAAPELEVQYEGKASLGSGEAKGGAEGGQGKSGEAAKLKMIFARGGVTLVSAANTATADEAQYEASTTVSTLIGNVVLVSSNERKATSERAEHNQAQDIAILTGNVIVIQGQNKLTGQRLVYDRKAATSDLDWPAADGRAAGRITAHLVQTEAQKAQAAKQGKQKEAPEPAVKPGLLGTAFKRDPNQPIDVESDLLHVDDKAKTATFRGAVHAKQGDFVIRTVELIATYKGETGLAAGGPSGAAAPGGAKGPGAQLTQIDAKKRVVITTKDGQTATGSWATFDVKTNIAIVGGGDVVLSQNKSVVKGNRLRIDMTTGMANVEDDPIPSVAETGTAAPAAPGKTVRPSAVFYPDEMKKQQEERKKQLQTQQQDGTAPRPVPRVVAPKGPSAGPSASPDGWRATTEPRQ